MNPHPLPNWNARKIREAAVPLKGKPLRDTKAYIKSLIDRHKMPQDTAFGWAFYKAIMN